jgi:hypothetical protein
VLKHGPKTAYGGKGHKWPWSAYLLVWHINLDNAMRGGKNAVMFRRNLAVEYLFGCTDGWRSMRLFYTTFTTQGPDHAKVMTALRDMRRSAFVSPTIERCTVVYDRKTEEQDFTEIEKLGKALSGALGAPILAAVLHDDDVLYLWLFQAGECCDFYDSLPQYFDPDAEPGPPEGGNSAVLCETFGLARKKKRVETLLRANLLDEELPEIPGELERHQALIRELGMPAFAAGVTYSSVEGNYLPEEFQDVKFTPVGSG